MTLKDAVNEFLRQFVAKEIEQRGVTEAAQELGIHRTSLHRLCNRLAIPIKTPFASSRPHRLHNQSRQRRERMAREGAH